MKESASLRSLHGYNLIKVCEEEFEMCRNQLLPTKPVISEMATFLELRGFCPTLFSIGSH